MSTRARWQILAALMLLFLGSGQWLGRGSFIPARLRFSIFPAEVAGYHSIARPVSNAVLRKLQLTDYLSRSYIDGAKVIGVYVGYHGIQHQGSTIHSPMNCLPGSGWSILQRKFIPLPGDPQGRRINRMLIGSGENHEIVYYWYQGRGRVIASEFTALGYQLRDIALRDRSDAALVRFIIPADDPAAETALRDFITRFVPLLVPYIPE